MKNICRWRKLVMDSKAGIEIFIPKGEKVTFDRVFYSLPGSIFDIHKDGNVTVIVLWGGKLDSEEFAEIETREEKDKYLLNNAVFGKDTFYPKGRDKITLSEIFELPSCIEASGLTAKENIGFIILWGNNSSAE